MWKRPPTGDSKDLVTLRVVGGPRCTTHRSGRRGVRSGWTVEGSPGRKGPTVGDSKETFYKGKVRKLHTTVGLEKEVLDRSPFYLQDGRCFTIYSSWPLRRETTDTKGYTVSERFINNVGNHSRS